VVEALRKQHAPREVVLVSKDINMRVKARALGLNAEDYQNDKTLEDGDLLYSGVLAAAADFWVQASGKTWKAGNSGGHTFYRIRGPIVPQLMINQFVYFEAPGEPSLYARVTEIRGKTAVLQTLKDFGSAKNAGVGRDRPQPRAELRHEPADGPGDRLRHPDRHGRHRQDAAGAGRRPDPGAGRPPLHRDHHDPRHRERGRGHRLPARHRGRKDGPLDGRAGRQPRSAGQGRRRQRAANGAAPPPTN
jgi:hypothetical protein